MRMRSPAIFLRTRARQNGGYISGTGSFLDGSKATLTANAATGLLLPGGVEMSAVRLIR